MTSASGIQPLRQVVSSKEWIQARTDSLYRPSTDTQKDLKTGYAHSETGYALNGSAERITSRIRRRSETVFKAGYASRELAIEDHPNQAKDLQGEQPQFQEALGIVQKSESEMASQPGWKEVNSNWILANQGLEFITPDTAISSLPGLLLPDHKVNNWGLPGHGEAKDDCGLFFRKICLNVTQHPDQLASFKTMTHRCYGPKCPICKTNWALRESDRITHRIEAFARKFNWLGRPTHIAVSVPPSLYHLSFKKLKPIMRRLLKKVGFLGGSVILHCYRQDEKTGLWYFSPHFHVIGFGWIKDVASTYEASGWVIKNLGVRNSVFGTAFYQLTHCAVWYGPGKKHSVTWIGLLSYNTKLKIPPRPTHSTHCPWCGDRMETAVREVGYPEPLPCPGIGGFYLASPEGWTTTYARRLEAMIPADMLIRPSRNDQIDLLFAPINF